MIGAAQSTLESDGIGNHFECTDIADLVNQLNSANYSIEFVAQLEQSQYFEKSLWNAWTPDLVERILNEGNLSALRSIVTLLITIINEKFRINLDVWDMLEENVRDGSSKIRYLFYSCWILVLHQESSSKLKSAVLQFLIHAFQSLEYPSIRRACMSVCGLASWTSLSERQINEFLTARPELAPLWRAVERRVKAMEKRVGSLVTYGVGTVLRSEDRFFHLDQRVLPDAIEQFLDEVEHRLSENMQLENLRAPTYLLQDQGLFSGIGSTGLERVTVPSLSNSMEVEGREMEAQSDNSDLAFRNEATTDIDPDDLLYVERFLEFLTDLISQLPTRRIARPLILAQQVVTRVRMSRLYRHVESALVRQLTEMLSSYEDYAVDDLTGVPLNDKDLDLRYQARVKQLQLLCFERFKAVPKLLEAALGTTTVFNDSDRLRSLFSDLTVEDLLGLADELGVVDALSFAKRMQQEKNGSATAPDPKYIRALLIEFLVHFFQRPRKLFEGLRETALFPVETFLWNPHLICTEDFGGHYSLALPKLNLQFLTIRDYLERNFILFRLESAVDARQDIEEAVVNIARKSGDGSFNHPSLSSSKGDSYGGMACEIMDFAVVLVKAPLLTSPSIPSEVRAELTVDLGNFSDTKTRQEWDTLKQHDVLFLAVLSAPDQTNLSSTKVAALRSPVDFLERFGVVAIRGCEVVEILDEERNSIGGSGAGPPFGKLRTIRVTLEPEQYKKDLSEDLIDLYSSFNLVIRRDPASNNFKSILKTIRQLIFDSADNLVIPTWIHDIFLGYGKPDSAHFSRLLDDGRSSISLDFFDTFVDLDHLKESFPGRKFDLSTVQDFSDGTAKEPLLCRLEFPLPLETESSRVAKVLPYKGEKRGPEAISNRNQLRFTPCQVEALFSGINPGLTLVVGPPGTGKTDTAAQLVLLLHKNYPNQKILVIAQSNQALNDLFEKIAKLDLDERYLLRLGMGEKDLKKDFSKSGRVDFMLKRRIDLLKIVQKLGHDIRAIGDVGSTCETAINFYRFHILYRIQRFQKQMDQFKDTLGAPDSGKTFSQLLKQIREQDGDNPNVRVPRLSYFTKAVADGSLENDAKIDEMCFLKDFDDALSTAFEEGRISIAEALFPFNLFFKDVLPGVTRPSTSPPDLESDIAFATSCFRYLSDLFQELEECRAFELLRNLHDRSDYLLTHHAKIVAMTSTHAALVRQQLIEKRFFYDSLIMEESAQILEVETFIPIVLQRDPNRLKRVVLIGDHHQLPPVVKNKGFQQYSRLDQSMFSRLIRLKVPFIQLDSQGRCRPCLRELFGWRYSKPPLKDLPSVTAYDLANVGLIYPYQFINVEDFEGKGEVSPSPYVYQNLGEAEFVVAVFMYLRLLGYSSDSIAILTTYNGQRKLIRDVILKRCGWNPLIGCPFSISTVDKFQGQQADIVLLSLVRTRNVGHLRDVRRAIVSVSRSRFGLYVFGRFSLFTKCSDLSPIIKKFDQFPHQLAIHPDELKASPHSGRKVDQQTPSILFVKDVYHMWALTQNLALKALGQLPSPPSFASKE